MSDLYTNATEIAYQLALASLSDAREKTIEDIKLAAYLGDWASVLRSIDNLTSDIIEQAREPLIAALLVGASQVAKNLPVSESIPALPLQQSELNILIDQQLSQLPEELQVQYAAALGRPTGRIARPTELPLIQQSLKVLEEKNLVSYSTYQIMDQQAKETAIVIAGVIRDEYLQNLRPLIESQIQAPSLQSFEQQLIDNNLLHTIEGNHIETAFRTTIQQLYSQGMENMLADPIVGDAFPYIERLPIEDSRLSEVCELASISGIDGTGIYLRSDPVWNLVKPPSHYNCRCGQNPLTESMAKRKGITRGYNVNLSPKLSELLRKGGLR